MLEPGTRRQRLWPTRACRVLAGLLAVPTAGLSVLRAVPAEWPVLGVQLVSFTPWLTLPAAGALLLALPARSRPLQVFCAALLAVHLFWLFPGVANRPVAASAGQSTAGIVAMTLNAELGGADAGEIVRLVRERHVDLLAIQEYSPALEARLSDEGLRSLLPNLVSHPREGATGSAVYSSYPVKELGLVADTPFSMPVVRLEFGDAGGGTALTVINVHAHAPVDDAVDQWRSDLAAVAGTGRGAGPLLLAGDFNATYDHREFRALLVDGGSRGGLMDVAVALGSRLVPTWPMQGYGLPGVTLDHLVTTPDITGSGYSVQRVSGTDHAAVIANLGLRIP